MNALTGVSFAGMTAKCLLTLEFFGAELALVSNGADLLLDRLALYPLFFSGHLNVFAFLPLRSKQHHQFLKFLERQPNKINYFKS